MHESLRIKYLDALGIPKHLYSQKPTNKAIEEKVNTKCLVIESANKDSFCVQGESRDFLLKMLGAISLASSDIECISVDANTLEDSVSKYNTQSILIMSSDLKINTNNCFSTHHPSLIINDDTLKREAWEVLKNLKQCLK